MKPICGSVKVLGLDPATQPIEVRSRISYLAEDQAMYGWMTAEELCRFLKPFYSTWDVRLAGDLLDRFGVPRRTRIKHLSKGQNVRLGLVLALAHRSEIVVLDDPTLGLDPISRKQFNRDIIEYLQAEKRTVFYSSHLLYEVEAVADAVGILDQGRIVRIGCTEDLQREIKRVVLTAEAVAKCPKPEKLLDVARDGARVLVTLDDSNRWIADLQADGVDHVVEDLSLDEIFEAFVIGRTDSWPGQSTVPIAAVA
jgi:ABC-2 type transport system ATP-binding protein